MANVTHHTDDVHDITSKQFDDSRRYRTFLVDGESPTLFDTGLPDGAEALVEGIKSTGVTPERLVITHGDHDHVGGLDAVMEAFDIELWVSAQTDLDSDYVVDVQFDDGDSVGPFEALHLPGHKSDSYAFVDEERRIAVFGDVMNGSDQRGLPAGFLVLPPAVYSTDLIQLEENLERLLAYDFDAAFVFHGSSVLEDAADQVEEFVEFPGKP